MLSGPKRWVDHRTIRHDCYLTTVSQYFGLSYFQKLWIAIYRGTNPISARVTHRRRTNVFEHRQHHIAHFAFILRRHDNDVWDAAQISDVEQPVVRRTIASRDAAPIKAKLHV